jgi:(p)ppGpp synthase/HD superfamily hydrolase
LPTRIAAISKWLKRAPERIQKTVENDMKDTGSQEPEPILHLTVRFARAIDYARNVHVGGHKKTEVPYMAHLLGVASLVMGEAGHVGFPIREDTVIAALLHDAVEDAGGWSRLHDIKANFGKDVAKIVAGCSDSFEEDSSKKQPWKVRKALYIERLPNESTETLLVSAADKLYNARAILEDYREIGSKIWERFNRQRVDQLWYFRELLKVYEAKCPDWRLVKELKRVVDELEQVSEPDRNSLCLSEHD